MIKELLVDYIETNEVYLKGILGGYHRTFGKNNVIIELHRATPFGYTVCFQSFEDDYMQDFETDITHEEIIVWLWKRSMK